jgi:Fe-Mn family superoxide dismutase
MQKDAKTATPEYNELKRRFGWEYNGMKLHELYFENMTKEKNIAIDKKSKLFKQIEKDFGSYENWEKDFKQTGAIRGIGWTILCKDNSTGQLFNAWVNEHDSGHLANSSIILIMDCFEHAFMPDYGTKRADYIAKFMLQINWRLVEKRF